MLFNLLVPLADEFGPFNLFRFLTFRTGGAVTTALLVCFLLGPLLIRVLRTRQGNGQPIRDDGPESHIINKQGTPTMGGFLILLGVGIGTLLWADLTNGYVWAVLLVTLGFGLVGFADDYLKVVRGSHRGLPAALKITVEAVIAAAAAYWIALLTSGPLSQGLAVPFFKEVLFDLGLFFVPLATFVIVGASNSVNLTEIGRASCRERV